MHVVISGGTGFLGRPLVQRLIAAGHRLTVISRSAAKVQEVFAGKAESAAMETPPAQFDAAISLAGESVSKRWNTRTKREIRDSRVNTTRALREAAERAGAHTLISASGSGFYGHTGGREVDESAPSGGDFLAKVCREWEGAAQSTKLRVAVLRIGIVFGPGSPALAVMARPFRMFVGGVVAGGRQYVPWVHVGDVLAMFQWALEDNNIRGPLNASTPEPITNRDLSKSLARALHRPCWVPVPAFAVRLMLGEMAQLALDSQRIVPRRAQELGFKFKHTDLDAAARDSF